MKPDDETWEEMIKEPLSTTDSPPKSVGSRPLLGKVIFRQVDDAKTGMTFFEEKLDDGSWVMVEGTGRAAEGNARYALMQTLEKRRQEKLKILRTYGPEEEFNYDA